jgi:hypothetical protein
MMGKCVMGIVLVLVACAATPAAGQEASAGARSRESETARAAAARDGARAQQAREQARAQARAQARMQATRHPLVEVQGQAVNRTFTGGPGDTLEFTNASGQVVITGGQGTSGRVVATPRARGRTDQEARHLLQQVDLEVTLSTGRVGLRAVPASAGSRVRMDYEITLPEGMGVNVKNMSGDVKVAKVTGEVRVEAVSGNVLAGALTQVRLLRTMSGDIELTGSTLEGDANLQTVSGSVLASTLKAGMLTLGSVSGDIRLAESTCEQATIRTVNGNIEFRSPAVMRGRYDLKSHAGDILVVTAGKTTGYVFEASTFSGAIDAAGSAGVRGAQSRERTVRGTVGDGAAFFDLTTFAGNIRIGGT